MRVRHVETGEEYDAEVLLDDLVDEDYEGDGEGVIAAAGTYVLTVGDEERYVHPTVFANTYEELE